jgi:hypothetical protein
MAAGDGAKDGDQAQFEILIESLAGAAQSRRQSDVNDPPLLTQFAQSAYMAAACPRAASSTIEFAPIVLITSNAPFS